MSNRIKAQNRGVITNQTHSAISSPSPFVAFPLDAPLDVVILSLLEFSGLEEEKELLRSDCCLRFLTTDINMFSKPKWISYAFSLFAFKLTSEIESKSNVLERNGLSKVMIMMIIIIFCIVFAVPY